MGFMLLVISFCLLVAGCTMYCIAISYTIKWNKEKLVEDAMVKKAIIDLITDCMDKGGTSPDLRKMIREHLQTNLR